MAEDVKKPSIFQRIARGFRDTRGEMKKVVWPSRKQSINNTLVVIVFMVIMAAIIFVLDFSFTGIIGLLFGGAA
ncbi:MAG: preprotein translocase subunit SecE [Oscillospiraceae bacterium]